MNHQFHVAQVWFELKVLRHVLSLYIIYIVEIVLLTSCLLLHWRVPGSFLVMLIGGALSPQDDGLVADSLPGLRAPPTGIQKQLTNQQGFNQSKTLRLKQSLICAHGCALTPPMT